MFESFLYTNYLRLSEGEREVEWKSERREKINRIRREVHAPSVHVKSESKFID